MTPEQRQDARDAVAELDATADALSQSDSLKDRLATGLLMDAAAHLGQLLDETEPAGDISTVRMAEVSL